MTIQVISDIRKDIDKAIELALKNKQQEIELLLRSIERSVDYLALLDVRNRR